MQNINEELKRMLYLTQHMRGVVISEQNTPGELTGVGGRKKSDVNLTTKSPNWDGKSSGTLDVSRFATSNLINANATNVGYNNELYNLTISTDIGKNLPTNVTIYKEPKTKEPKKFSNYEFIDESFPYDDNMITPKFTTNYTFESLVNYVKDDIVDRLKKGEKLKIKIQGFADSARPGIRGPKGTKKEVEDDHKQAGCSDIYCGEKIDAKRNLWLAENRAKRMGNLLNTLVKQSSNNDITNLIEYLEPISSFDPSVSFEEGKRVGKRSVTLKIESINFSSTPGETEPGSIETITITPVPKQGTVVYGDTTLNIIEVIGKTGYSEIVVENGDNAEKLIGNVIPDVSQNKLNGKTTVNGEIKGSEVFVDGLSWGNLDESREGAYAKIRYATPGMLCFVGYKGKNPILRAYTVILSDLPY